MDPPGIGETILFLSILLLISTPISEAVRGGRKSPDHRPVKFHDVDSDFYKNSRSSTPNTFKLGYKILLVCVAEGFPRPQFKWYKDGAELTRKNNFNLYQKEIGSSIIKSKIEIDPATLGDQGIYTCLASNTKDYDMKNFKTEYYY